MPKEKLPLAFITSTVSHGWDEVGNLKASIEGIKNTFTGTKEVENILQDFVDSYLVCIGRLEKLLDDKNYVDMPEEKDLSESFLYERSNKEEAVPFEAKKFEDNNKTEIFTELPNYSVEVEQKNNKVEIELEPKFSKFNKDEFEDSTDDTFTPINGENDPALQFTADKPETEKFDFFVDDFGEPSPDLEADSEIKKWLNR